MSSNSVSVSETPAATGSVAGVYDGRRVALLTQHGKERVIAPVLESALGCRIALVAGYDTDQLGTFTRDVARAGNQLEAVRKKARMGIVLSCLPLGLASEGSFGPDPFTGMFPWNRELLIFLDDERQLEIVGMAQGRAVFAQRLTEDWSAAESFARECAFPEHHLVVRPHSENELRMRKGIHSHEQFRDAFAWARSESDSGLVFLETDVRAHANPTRMQIIRLAAEDLAKRIASHCPACGTPGYWIVENIPGLQCASCGTPTGETRADVLGCLTCAYREHCERTDAPFADPSRCDYCNP